MLLAFAYLTTVAATAQTISPEQLRSAGRDTAAWLSYGRDPLGQRYVELNQITSRNVERLQPAWVFATGGENRGLQATPLVHDGVIYLSADGSRVFAINARTGAKKWVWDPKISRETERVYCCGAINRGLAMLGDYVYIGTLDARLVALRKATGEVAWETQVIDWRQGYSITGAPLALKDMVLTGVAGGEFGIRGFVKVVNSAFAALLKRSMPKPESRGGRRTRSRVRGNRVMRHGPATHGKTAARQHGRLDRTTRN
jgi:glucose dehydrogenase